MNDDKPKRTRVAAYGLVREREKLLLCRIAPDYPNALQWTLPGGGIDFGEHPEVGVVREVYEETGLNVRVRTVAGVNSFYHEFPDVYLHGISILYHVEVVGGSLRFEVDGSTDRCEWHPIDRVPQLDSVPLIEVALDMIDGG